MLYSKLFGKTRKEVKNFDSVSHKLLIQAGFVDQVASGIYNLLPLGKRVLKNIEEIIRQELNQIGAQEIEMPLIHPKKLWQITDRWQTVDVLFKVRSRFGQEYALAPTHEETVTPLVKGFIKSYKDLPLALYHITKKFRDEPRPKSGILRGREFGMKDLYSFHTSKNDLKNYYKKVTQTYIKIFSRCGLNNVKITEASGGSFTKKFSHEFNVITEAGEVDLFYCSSCTFAQNAEISQLKLDQNCPRCRSGHIKAGRAIEVGNIFDLGLRFSQAFDLKYKNKKGIDEYPYMGCYGIGTTRLMGAIVEINHDNRGIIWPKEIAPYQVHLIGLNLDEKEVFERAYKFYQKLVNKNIQVLFDDREKISIGEKLNDADLIGLPIRLLISRKTIDQVEVKKRDEKLTNLLSFEQILKKLT